MKKIDTDCVKEAVIGHRRTIHRLAELGGKEYKTRDYVLEKVRHLGLPYEMEEAARVDGCGPIRTYVRIMLPMAQSSLLVCGVLSLVWHWNDYFEPGVYITATDRKMLPHRLPSLYALLNAENFNMIQMTDIEGLIFNEAMLMAATFLCILPILIMYLILQRRFMEGVERSGLTGM